MLHPRRLTSLVFVLVILAVAAAWAQPKTDTFTGRLQEYRDFCVTWAFYSEEADKAEDHTSAEYQQIYTAGHFFRNKVRQATAALKKEIKGDPDQTMAVFHSLLKTDAGRKDFAVYKKLIGFNISVLKAINPSYQPSLPGVKPITTGRQNADVPTPGLATSIENMEVAHPPLGPLAPVAWADNQFRADFFRGVPVSGQPGLPGFEQYQGEPAGVQPADTAGKLGWVSAQYAVKEGDQVVIKGSTLNVRAGPSTDDAAIGQVRQGQSFPLVAEQNGWFQIRLPAAAPSTGAGTGSYCKISLVKGNVPFLSQFDSFLRPREVILTFDDGPTTIDNRTAGVNANLKKYGASGVFFVLGNSIRSPETQKLVSQTRSAGSHPAVHGYYHSTKDGKPFTAIPWETIKEHLTTTKKAIRDLTGIDPVFFRPPYGIIRKADLDLIISDLKLIPVGWTIDSLDWSTKNPDELFTKITQMLTKRGKGILLMHDIHSQSCAVVPRLLEWMKNNGFTVVGPERLIDGFNAARN